MEVDNFEVIFFRAQFLFIPYSTTIFSDSFLLQVCKLFAIPIIIFSPISVGETDVTYLGSVSKLAVCHSVPIYSYFLMCVNFG